MKKLITLLIVVGMLVGVGSCCFCFPGEEPKKAKKQQTINVLPGIRYFLRSHPEFGSPTSVQNIPNWANGQRQRVHFSIGRSLLFYLEQGRVILILADDRSRTRIWEL